VSDCRPYIDWVVVSDGRVYWEIMCRKAEFSEQVIQKNVLSLSSDSGTRDNFAAIKSVVAGATTEPLFFVFF
jgi:hypothetical protein